MTSASNFLRQAQSRRELLLTAANKLQTLTQGGALVVGTYGPQRIAFLDYQGASERGESLLFRFTLAGDGEETCLSCSGRTASTTFQVRHTGIESLSSQTVVDLFKLYSGTAGQARESLAACS